MNSIGRPFVPPVQPPAPAPPPPPPPPLPPVPGIDGTLQLATTLTATTASFLEPADLAHFAQTSRHNHLGAEMAVRARLKQEVRSLAQPLAQFADPKQRLDTAVPIDATGLRHLAGLTIKGPLSIDLIKTGACSIQEVERRLEDIEAYVLCPEVEEEEVFTYETVVDYIVAEKVSCDEVYELRESLTETVIENLGDDMVRACIQKGYLTFQQAVNLTDSDVELLNSDAVKGYVARDGELNINELLIRNLITREFADIPGNPEIESTIQASAGMDFHDVRSHMDTLRSSLFGGASIMDEVD